MKYLAAPILLLCSVPLAVAESLETTAPAGGNPNPAAASSPARPGTTTELSDDVLGEVNDNNQRAADGPAGEEEQGDTLDQTLRTQTRATH